MTGVCSKCGKEYRVRSVRGSSLAGLVCSCGGALRGKGAGAIKRGRCSVCDRLTEFTVPDVLTSAIQVRERFNPHTYLRDAKPGEYVCRNHSLNAACGCPIVPTRRKELGYILGTYYGGDCAIHGRGRPGPASHAL